MAPSPRRANNQAQEHQYDISVEAATHNYSYSDSDVTLKVYEKTFRVARNRLTQRSQVLRDLFTVPQPDDEEDQPIVLRNDPDDFEHFLWFIHADPIDYMTFENNQNDDRKVFDRCVSIAGVAHMYDVMPAANWAIDKALATFKSRSIWHPRDANRLLQAAALWHTDPSQRRDSARKAIVKMIHHWAHSGWSVTRASRPLGDVNYQPQTGFRDILLFIVLLEQRTDEWLLGHLYYYVLVYTTDGEKSETRLRSIDRQRLLCGFHTLVQKGILTGREQDDREAFGREGVDARISEVRDQLWSYFNSSSWASPYAPVPQHFFGPPGPATSLSDTLTWTALGTFGVASSHKS